MYDALPKQIEARSAVHGALDQLEAVDLPFDRPVAPRLRNGRLHGGFVLSQPGDQAAKLTRDGRIQPRFQSGGITRA